jgi:hypothetical protein
MKLLILSLLSVLLGILIYLNFTFNSAKSVSNAEKDYLTQEYTIIKVDKTGYFGESENGMRIYIKKENVKLPERLQEHDSIVVYFEKESRKDGLVKVEKLEERDS